MCQAKVTALIGVAMAQLPLTEACDEKMRSSSLILYVWLWISTLLNERHCSRLSYEPQLIGVV